MRSAGACVCINFVAANIADSMTVIGYRDRDRGRGKGRKGLQYGGVRT